MNLQVKFSLIFLLVFGVQLGVAGYVCDGFLQSSARDQVIRQARLMMESSLATRTYTEEQIKPLVHRNDPAFHPQIVPAYAATEHFNYFRNAYPEYSYKEATLNPTNPRDRAVEWEADIVNFFRNNPDKKDFSGERDTPMGRSLYLARPIKALTPCLVCHSPPEAAPPNVVKVYANLADLCSELATNFAGNQERTKFLEQCRQQFGLIVPPASSLATKAPAPAEPASGVVWEPAMLEKTKRELAVYIGPVATFIVDSTASEVHTVKDFYDALCREIPSNRDRELFLSSCKAGI